MRWDSAAILVLFAFALAAAVGCGGSGSDNVTVTTRSSFPQGLLPVPFTSSQGSGDVTLRIDGDLFAVDGVTANVTKVSNTTGDDDPTFATGVGTGNALQSITVGFGDDTRLFVGDSGGKIWIVNADGTSSDLPFLDTGSGHAVTGLSFAPEGFGSFGGQLFAAAGTGGVWRAGDSNSAFASGNYVDLAFSGTTLFAIDDATNKIVTVNASGVATELPSTPAFIDPVGMAVDSSASEIYVADAGDDVLYTVPVAGGTPTARAAYSFDGDAPSGIAHDGFAALVFITTNPPAIRGSNLPRINPTNPAFGGAFVGTTVGYGDLELDRFGAFVLAANAPDSQTPANTTNFLFSAARDLSAVTALASKVGSTNEELLGVAVDSVGQRIFVSTSLGKVFRRNADGSGMTGDPFVHLGDDPVLGLEVAPPRGNFADRLVATDEDGQIFAINPDTGAAVQVLASPTGEPLVDLVFALDGTLYALENDESGSRILQIGWNGVAGAGTVDPLNVSGAIGLPDGIEIDEGANRLLVTSELPGAAGDKLLAVDLDTGAVTNLKNIDIDDGFFPTGVVYDRLGTAVVRQRNDAASLVAHSIGP